MSDMIVDSCVVAKWILPESDSDKAVLLYDSIVAQGKKPTVLDLSIVETANVVWKKVHLRRIPPEDARQSLTDLLSLPLQILPANKFFTAALEVAIKYDRSVYDALFVALAEDMQLTGVTADEPL